MPTVNLNIKKICEVCHGTGIDVTHDAQGHPIQRECTRCEGEGKYEWGHAKGNIPK